MHAFHADINKRLSIVSASSSMMGDVFHFADGYDYYGEYGYDGCGSLTRDKNKGVRQIAYDFNGMPTSVWFENGSITEYVYTADGVKLKTIHRTAVDGIEAVGSSPELSEQNTHHKDSTLYVGAYEISTGLKRCKYNFANGYVDISGAYVQSYNYFAKDHLGNVRHVAYNIPNRKSSILQKNNYYPFGGLHNEEDNRLSQNKLYNGKEYDPMHGLNLYDYSARQYDAAIGQFTSMDPLCEKYYHISPYAYCAGNPVKYVDPDGKQVVTFFGISEPLILTGRTPVTLGDASKFVNTTNKVSRVSNDTQIHHVIPKQFKPLKVVQKGIRGGFKFEGWENKIPLEKFLKSTGKGVHGNHPKYSEQIRQKIDDIPSDLSPIKTAGELRKIVKGAVKDIKNNPNTKINDIKLRTSVINVRENH